MGTYMCLSCGDTTNSDSTPEKQKETLICAACRKTSRKNSEFWHLTIRCRESEALFFILNLLTDAELIKMNDRVMKAWSKVPDGESAPVQTDAMVVVRDMLKTRGLKA